MKIMTKYVDALNRRNVDDLTALFADDCHFFDKAPRLLVGHDICVQGKEAVRSFFENLFREHAVASELLVDMGDRALYNVSVGRMLLRCKAQISVSQGKIQSMEIVLRNS